MSFFSWMTYSRGLTISDWEQRQFADEREERAYKDKRQQDAEALERHVASVARIPRDPAAIAEREKRLAAINRRLWWKAGA
jgi:hypothetical protein